MPTQTPTNSAQTPNRLTIIQPDDWHIHLRDGDALATTVPHAAATFNRVICMPNLVPPVKTTQEASAYRERILQALADSDLSPSRKNAFNPRMVLYLTDNTDAKQIAHAHASGVVQAVKLYPAGATTNSADGVTDLKNCHAVLEALQKYAMPLLVHGEVTHGNVDIFDREACFLDSVLSPLLKDFPELKVVVEHITTADAVEFVMAHGDNVAATITPQHLLFNRNHMLVGGIKPHYYCLPILKRQRHQHALIKAATSGNPKFFLGTDSAPHTTNTKENACGCAGCYSAPIAISLYANAFEQAGALDKLEGFASIFGALFYGLPVNNTHITLIKSPLTIPEHYPYFDNKTLTPLLAGSMTTWQIQTDR